MSESDTTPTHDGAEVIRCWCGVTGTVDELFDDYPDASTCGGMGVLNCVCGGDLCVCHNHGEYECPGCEECCYGDEGDGIGDGFDDY